MTTIEERLAALEARAATPTPQAAPLGWFQVAPGETILSDHMNTVVRYGAVPFASAAARTAAWAAPHAGALTYLQDKKRYEQWTGSAWLWVAGTPIVGAAGPGGDMTNLVSGWTRVPLVAGGTLEAGYFAVTGDNGLQLVAPGSYRVDFRVAFSRAAAGITRCVVAYTPTAPGTSGTTTVTEIDGQNATNIHLNAARILGAGTYYLWVYTTPATNAVMAGGRSGIEARYLGPN